MFRFGLLVLCWSSIIVGLPTTNYVVKLDVINPKMDRNTSLNFNQSISENRIINGNNAPYTPWVVMVVIDYHPEAGTLVPVCGGSLVSPQYVLTARNCVFQGANPKSQNMWIFIGKEYFYNGIPYPVKEIEVYNILSNDDDVALLKLGRDVSGIQPISVQYEDNINYGGKRATIYGYGYTEPSFDSHLSPKLKTADVVLQSRDQCPRNSVCSDPRITNTNACFFDIGGPLILQENGKLIGIISTIAYDAMDVSHPCVYSTYYTSTSYYGSWIRNVINGIN